MNRRRIIRQKVRILRREAIHQVVRKEVQDQAVRHPEEVLHQEVLYLEADSAGSSASENGTSGSSSSNDASHQTEQTGSSASGSDGQADSNKNTTQDKNSDHLEDDRTNGNTDNTAQNNKISTRKDMEIRTKSAVKNIKEEIAEEDAPDGRDTVNTFIPKVYNDTVFR